MCGDRMHQFVFERVLRVTRAMQIDLRSPGLGDVCIGGAHQATLFIGVAKDERGDSSLGLPQDRCDLRQAKFVVLSEKPQVPGRELTWVVDREVLC